MVQKIGPSILVPQSKNIETFGPPTTKMFEIFYPPLQNTICLSDSIILATTSLVFLVLITSQGSLLSLAMFSALTPQGRGRGFRGVQDLTPRPSPTLSLQIFSAELAS